MDPKQRMIRRDFDLNFEGVSLKAYTKTIDGKEVKFLGGTASSTAQDLYGDVITAEGQVMMLNKLKDLAEQLKGSNSGLTAWLNHSYKLPEDCLGAFVNASLSTRDEDGVSFIDLDIECRVTDTNPRAVAAWEQVKDGIRHGWSIGAIFTEAEWMSDDPASPDFWSLLVSGVNLLEISLVGIPANQRAWCKNAADAKAHAVKVAEDIVREAHAKKGADRSALRDPVELRGMVLKSLVHDGVADSTSTSPITAREVAQPQLELDVDSFTGAVVKDAETLAAGGVESTDETPSEVQASAEVEQTAGAETTEPVTEQASGDVVVTDESTQAGAEVPAQAEAPSDEAETTVTEPTAAASGDTTVVVLDSTSGTVTLEGADDHKIRNLEQLGSGDPKESSELASELRVAAESGVVSNDLATLAADSIDALRNAVAALEKRDSTGGDQVALAIGHIAKAVGHGLCVRSTKHIAEALECLSGSVGQSGDDEDSSENLSAQVSKLEPKAGDVLVIRLTDSAGVEAARTLNCRSYAPEGVGVLFVTNESAATIDNELGTKAQTLEQLEAQIVEKTAALNETEAAIVEKTASIEQLTATETETQQRVTELEAKKAELEATRSGRKSFDMNAVIERANGVGAGDSETRPEDYQRNSVQQRAALSKQLSGDAQAPTGRDIAAGLS